MKRGDIVTIYEDPITQKVSEGKATLIKQIGEQHSGSVLMQRWRVRFVGFSSSGTFERAIQIKDRRQA